MAARRPLLLLLIALTATLCACSHSTNTSGGQPLTRILLRGGGPDPDSLDPQRARSVEAHEVLRDICEGLTELDKNAGVAPGVASSWTTSPDGKTYTFKLRPNARWSNGDKIVAADFVAGLQIGRAHV